MAQADKETSITVSMELRHQAMAHAQIGQVYATLNITHDTIMVQEQK